MRRKAALVTALFLAASLFGGCRTGAPGTTGSAAVTDAAVSTEVTEAAATTAATEAAASAAASYTPRSQLLRCLYYEDRDFRLYDGGSEIFGIGGEAVCGVAPHHLTAGKLIAGMYRTAAETRDDTETVVVIAPMHYDSAFTLTTSRKGWQTAFGSAENDTEITDLFISELGAADDDAMTEYDHSASSHIPFIKRYLPDAKVACLLVSPKERGDIPKRLSELLGRIAAVRKCFFAFSIDFSHYLDPEDAESHDKETLSAVTSGDTAAIARFTNANVDTPYCLNTFVLLSSLLGGEVTECAHSNTWRLGELPYSRTEFPEGVTSYFVFLAETTG